MGGGGYPESAEGEWYATGHIYDITNYKHGKHPHPRSTAIWKRMMCMAAKNYSSFWIIYYLKVVFFIGLTYHKICIEFLEENNFLHARYSKCKVAGTKIMEVRIYFPHCMEVALGLYLNMLKQIHCEQFRSFDVIWGERQIRIVFSKDLSQNASNFKIWQATANRLVRTFIPHKWSPI